MQVSQVLGCTRAYADEIEVQHSPEIDGEIYTDEYMPEDYSDVEPEPVVMVRQLRSGESGSESSDSSDSGVNLWQYITDYLLGSANNGQANRETFDTLCWYWYHYPDKRDKIPIQPYGPEQKMPSDFDNMGEWTRYLDNTYAGQYLPYRMVGFDDDLSFDVTSPQFEAEFAKWYEYFTGQGDESGGGGGNEGQIASSVTLQLTPLQTFTGEYSFYVYTSFDTTNLSYVSTSEKYTIACNPNQTNYPYVPTATFYMSNGILDQVSNLAQGRPVAIVITGTDGYIYIADSITVTDRNENTKWLNYSGNVFRASWTVSGNGVTFTADAGGYYNGLIFKKVGNSLSFSSINDGQAQMYRNFYAILNVDSGGGGEQEPTEPVWPTPPEPYTPEPPEPPQQPTAPVYNTTNNTYNNNTTNNNTTTTTTDLNPILEAIRIVNDNIINETNLLHDDITTCCNNMRAMLTAYFDKFLDWFGYLGEGINQIIEAIYDFEPLMLEQLRQAVKWLRGIYYKLGSGNAGKPDITIDPDGAHDWLEDLLEKLLGLLPASIQDLLAVLSPLRYLFPFCIPWDIAAMMALLGRSPVTPVFDLPWPYGMANGQVVYASCHVDCTPWNGYAATCRAVWRVLFAYYLAWCTKTLLRNVEIEA